MDFNVKKIMGYKSYKRMHMEPFNFITYDFYKDYTVSQVPFSAEPIYSLAELTKLHQAYCSLLSFGLACCIHLAVVDYKSCISTLYEPSNNGLFNKP